MLSSLFDHDAKHKLKWMPNNTETPSNTLARKTEPKERNNKKKTRETNQKSTATTTKIVSIENKSFVSSDCSISSPVLLVSILFSSSSSSWIFSLPLFVSPILECTHTYTFITLFTYTHTCWGITFVVLSKLSNSLTYHCSMSFFFFDSLFLHLLFLCYSDFRSEKYALELNCLLLGKCMSAYAYAYMWMWITLRFDYKEGLLQMCIFTHLYYYFAWIFSFLLFMCWLDNH